MNAAISWTIRHQGILGLGLLAALLSPPLRSLLEARMTTHMLLQVPLLMLTGALLADCTPPALRRWLQTWNAYGIAGLTFVAVVLALAMVPRLLDLALLEPGVEALKFACLLLSGAALRGAWRRAGLVLQGFFLGNTLPMMAIAGWLYEIAPARLCNAYRLDEQQWLGQALTWTATLVGVVWLWQAGWRLTRPVALLNATDEPATQSTGVTRSS